MAILRVSDKVLSAILLSAFSVVLDLSTTDMGNNSNKIRDKKKEHNYTSSKVRIS